MPEPADPPAKPLRTWGPMILWTAGILLALGLAWFVGAVMVPMWQTHKVVRECAEDRLDDVDDGKVLNRLGNPEQAAGRLATYLRLPRWMNVDRREAALLLGRCGPRAVPTLIKELTDTDSDVRRLAAVALGMIGPEAETAVPALTSALEDRDAGVRQAAAEALGQVGPAARVAVPVLIGRLEDTDESVRGYAALALGTIGAEAKDAVPALVKGLKDTDVNVRWRAAHALGEIGPSAKPAIPTLERALTDRDAAVRQAAAEALKKIQGDEPPK